MPCESENCIKVKAIVERLAPQDPASFLTVFDADSQGMGFAPPTERTVFIRFVPGDKNYAYDLILGTPLTDSVEDEIRQFIEVIIKTPPRD